MEKAGFLSRNDKKSVKKKPGFQKMGGDKMEKQKNDERKAVIVIVLMILMVIGMLAIIRSRKELSQQANKQLYVQRLDCACRTDAALLRKTRGITLGYPAIAPVILKTASPKDINIAGTGNNEETTVMLTIKGTGDERRVIVPIDVVFALDSSGSMTETDPADMRISAARNFIKKLNPSRDRIGIVSWDHSTDFTQWLTSDHALVQSKLRTVDSHGGTNFNAGLGAAISILDRGKREHSVKVIIFLTDGLGAYTCADNPGSPADEAYRKGYAVYTVGLGGLNYDCLLTDMAAATGGKYFSSPRAVSLERIFNDIYTEIAISTIPHYVNVTEVTQNYIIDEGSFSRKPDNVIRLDGTTMIQWNNIGMGDGQPDFSGDEQVTLSFRAKCNQSGFNLKVGGIRAAEISYSDKSGNSAASITVPQAEINVNTRPDVSDAYAYKIDRWVNGRRFVDVTVKGVTDPDGDKVTTRITGISSSEGTTSPGKSDAYALGGASVRLRPRHSKEDKSKYEIRFTAGDGRGGETQGSLLVRTPAANEYIGYRENSDPAYPEDGLYEDDTGDSLASYTDKQFRIFEGWKPTNIPSIPTETPEPATIILLGAGLLCLAMMRKRF